MYNSDPVRHFAISHQPLYVCCMLCRCVPCIYRTVCAHPGLIGGGPPDAGDTYRHSIARRTSQIRMNHNWQLLVFLFGSVLFIYRISNIECTKKQTPTPMSTLASNQGTGLLLYFTVYRVQCTRPESRAIPGRNRGIFSNKVDSDTVLSSFSVSSTQLTPTGMGPGLRTRLTENGDRRTPGEPSTFDFPGLY